MSKLLLTVDRSISEAMAARLRDMFTDWHRNEAQP